MKRISKERKDKIMEIVTKAGSEEYETSWDDMGVPFTIKKKSKNRDIENTL